MIKSKKRFYFYILFLFLLTAILILHQILTPRSALNHIVRRMRGESGAEQVVNDLAQDLKNQGLINTLQKWASDTMLLFDKGMLKTNTDIPNWNINAIVLDSSQCPEFIKHERSQPPEIAVMSKTNGPAYSIVIDWYLYGIVIVRSNGPIPFYVLYSLPIGSNAFAVWYDNK